MANTNPITIPTKSTNDSLTAAEFNQLLGALKDGTFDITTLGLIANTTLLNVDEGAGTVSIGGATDINGDLTVDNVTLASAIVREGDTDTKIVMNPDRITMTAGNVTMIDMLESGVVDSDYVELMNGTVRIAQNGQTSFRNGDTSAGANNYVQHLFGYAGADDYPHFVVTRHNSTGDGNGIDFYTCDGTQAGVYPTNAVHGLTIDNGLVGIGGVTNPSLTLDVGGSIGMTNNNYLYSRTSGGVVKRIAGIASDNKVYLGAIDDAGSSVIIREDGADVITLSGGNVGIGSTSPSYLLDVRSATSPRIVSNYQGTVQTGINSASGLGKIGTITSHDLSIETADTERVRIDTSGNVGIGTTSPSGNLDVQGSTNTSVYIGNQGTASNRTDLHIYSGSSNNGYIWFEDSGNNERGAISYEHGSDAMKFNTAATTAMTIDSSGNVGIGVVPASGRILQVSDGTNAILNLLASNTGISRLEFADSDDVDIGRINYDHTTDTMSFWTNNADRMYINSSGEVSIGTTSAGAQLYVESSATNAYGFQSINTANVTATVNAINRFDNRGTLSTKDVLQIDNDSTLNWGLSFAGGNGKNILLEQVNSAANPALAFGDGDTGLYEESDDVLAISLGGTRKWQLSGNAWSASTTGGARIINQNATATVPTYAFNDDNNTGIGSAAADQLSLIAGGVEAMRLTSSLNTSYVNVSLSKASNPNYLVTTGSQDVNLGIATTGNAFVAGSSAGDGVLRAEDGDLWLATRHSGGNVILSVENTEIARTTTTGIVLPADNLSFDVGASSEGKFYTSGSNVVLLVDDQHHFQLFVDNTSPASELVMEIKDGDEPISFFRDVTEYVTETAGELLAAGDVCYLKSDGKYWKVDADAEATTKGKLLIANAAISADATGQFIKKGIYTTTGLTTGSTYFVSTTAGGYTATAPSTSGQFIRAVGVALSTTELEFDPSKDYYEVA